MAGPVQAAPLVNPTDHAVAQAFTQDRSNPITNEGNLLSLLTFNSLVGNDSDSQKIIQEMAKHEMKHMLVAMKILATEGVDPRQKAYHAKMQEKYGQDMHGAVALTLALKEGADIKEKEMAIAPAVEEMLYTKTASQQVRGGFQLAKQAAEFQNFKSFYDK